MKKILYFCDRCKQEIEDNPVKVFMDALERDCDDFVYDDPYPELKQMDFCKNCADFLVGLIKRHCEKGVPAVPNKEFEKAVQEMISPPQRRRSPEGSWMPGK